MEFLKALNRDEAELRTKIADLKCAFSSPEWKLKAFKDLALEQEAHAKALEATFYKLVQPDSLDGLSEHLQKSIERLFSFFVITDDVINQIRREIEAGCFDFDSSDECLSEWDRRLNDFANLVSACLTQEQVVLGCLEAESPSNKNDLGSGDSAVHYLRVKSVAKGFSFRAGHSGQDEDSHNVA